MPTVRAGVVTTPERADLGRIAAARAESPVRDGRTADAIRAYRDEDQAERWISRPIVSLGGNRPIDRFDEADGYERVRETLPKIEHGR